MNSIQLDIKSKMKALHIGNVINWVAVDKKLPPENFFVLVVKEGFLPYTAMLENGKWNDYSDTDNKDCNPTHWTEFKQPCL